MKLPGRLDALRERNFRLFFVGQANVAPEHRTLEADPAVPIADQAARA